MFTVCNVVFIFGPVPPKPLTLFTVLSVIEIKIFDKLFSLSASQVLPGGRAGLPMQAGAPAAGAWQDGHGSRS